MLFQKNGVLFESLEILAMFQLVLKELDNKSLQLFMLTQRQCRIFVIFCVFNLFQLFCQITFWDYLLRRLFLIRGRLFLSQQIFDGRVLKPKSVQLLIFVRSLQSSLHFYLFSIIFVFFHLRLLQVLLFFILMFKFTAFNLYFSIQNLAVCRLFVFVAVCAIAGNIGIDEMAHASEWLILHRKHNKSRLLIEAPQFLLPIYEIFAQIQGHETDIHDSILGIDCHQVDGEAVEVFLRVKQLDIFLQGV